MVLCLWWSEICAGNSTYGLLSCSFFQNKLLPSKKKECIYFVNSEKSRTFAVLLKKEPLGLNRRDVVQLVVYLVWDQGVARSSRVIPTNKGRLAQLVQSICLTSRGSAVRIRQRPQRKTSVFLFLFIISFPCVRTDIPMLNKKTKTWNVPRFL